MATKKYNIDDFLAELDNIHENIKDKDDTETDDFDAKLLKYLNSATSEFENNFHKIKKMTQYVKDAVIGYLRIIAEEFIIPDLVLYTCLVFYHEVDVFIKHGENLNVDESRHIVSSYAWLWNTTYGHKLININESSIVNEWKFQIIKHTKNKTEIIIGLINTDSEELPTGNANEFNIDLSISPDIKHEAYGYGTDGNKYKHDNKADYGYLANVDDIIKMVLDTTNDKLKLLFYKNDVSQGIAFTKMNKKYVRLAISLVGDCSVQILQ